MGLDCSHDCWRGAYSSFSRWREAIAVAAGYVVWPVKFDSDVRDTIMLDWGHVTEANLAGEWDKTPDDPLIVIFAHSDCDGVIHPEQGRRLADALETILPKLDASGTGHILAGGGMKGCTERFIKGLRKAASKGEDVTFG